MSASTLETADCQVRLVLSTSANPLSRPVRGELSRSSTGVQLSYTDDAPPGETPPRFVVPGLEVAAVIPRVTAAYLGLKTERPLGGSTSPRVRLDSLLGKGLDGEPLASVLDRMRVECLVVPAPVVPEK